MTHQEKIDLSRQIREFETEIGELHKAGKIPGTVHLSIGQEFPSVDIISQLDPDDIIFTTHRGHHHYLAHTKDFRGLKDELMGLETGVNGGKMGSQHFHVVDKFYAHGLQGAMCPVACGVALGLKMSGSKRVVCCFMGDGTLGEGVLYESLNMASLWKLPIIFIVENNYWAMSTRVTDGVAGSINARFHAFGLRHCTPWNLKEHLPSFLVLDTYRLCGHSPRDPDIRPKEEKEAWEKRDILATK